MKNIRRIALCGAHGTGKTTIAKVFGDRYGVDYFGSLRSRWADFGIADFDLLPVEVRTIFQHKMLNSQIKKEDENWKKGFVTDRSVLDYLSYTLQASDMKGDILQMYKNLVKDRLNRYSHVIYFPVEFEVENEHLRADVSTRGEIDSIIQKYLDKYLPGKYCRATGNVEERVEQIINYIEKDSTDKLKVLKVEYLAQ